MSYSVPPAVGYPDKLSPITVAFNSSVYGEPDDGRRMVPAEIRWATMGNNGTTPYMPCVSFNTTNIALHEFSGIKGISVDNSGCGTDIIFVFTDTSETTVIPAYTPKAIVPIFTNSVMFYVIANNPTTDDVTRFSILNFMPSGCVVPVTQEQNFAAISGIATTAGTTVIIPSTDASGKFINGTIENGYAGFFDWSSGAEAGAWALQDGTGMLIAGSKIGAAGGSIFLGTVWEANNIHIRFRKGISLIVTGGPNDGSLSVNLYYRRP